jgi:hypothetical protein
MRAQPPVFGSSKSHAKMPVFQAFYETQGPERVSLNNGMAVAKYGAAVSKRQ